MCRLDRRVGSSLAVAALLVAGGCSKGGDGTPAPSCTRWTPGTAAGPGDALGYFPLAPRDRWSVRAVDAWESLEVSGTRPVLGYDARVLAAFDLDTRARLGEVYRAVDDHGLVELGNDDPGDALTPLIVPAYVARFPIVVGDAFTSVDCKDLDYGEDLDGDGKNERMDVRLVVTVGAVEPVTTPIATFGEAARIEQRLALTVRATSVPDQVTLEALARDWYAPGVGLVREVVEIPVGTPAPAVELVGYAVGDVAKGLLARRDIAASLRGPYASAPLGGGFLVAGSALRAVTAPVAIAGVVVTPGAAVGAPFDLVALPPSGLIELSPPAMAPLGGGAAVVTASWNGLGGEVRLQRVTSGGALRDPPEGTVIGTGIPSWSSYGCGPAIAYDGTDLLAAWIADGGIAAARIGASGVVLGETAIGAPAPERPRCPVVAFDGTDYLVVYQTREDVPVGVDRLRAVHVGTGGAVAEETPLLLSDTPGVKRPIAMVFDGTAHVLLLADGRDGVATALTLRRLSRAGGWLDGDAATGGVVLLPGWASMNGASLYGESVTLDGATPMVAWATGANTLPALPSEEAWVTRLGPDGAPRDLHGGLPGVDVYLGGPMSCAGVASPLALGGADGIPEVLYSSEWNDRCGSTPGPQLLRSVTFGL